MSKVRFIGDVHGKVHGYKAVIKNCDLSIQVGDMGAGFVSLEDLKDTRHRFIRGNHDDPAICRSHPLCIDDGVGIIMAGQKVMFVGGAYSIDHAWRTMGKNLWEDEELSWPELNAVIDVYKAFKPDVMVTHEMPDCAVEHVFTEALDQPFHKFVELSSRTRDAFDAMLDAHQPKLWIFGHWHIDADVMYRGTRFICLNELSYVDVDMKTLDVGRIVPRKEILPIDGYGV